MLASLRSSRARLIGLAATATVVASALGMPAATGATTVTSTVVETGVAGETSAALALGTTSGHSEAQANVAYRYMTKKVCTRTKGRVSCRKVTTRYRIPARAPIAPPAKAPATVAAHAAPKTTASLSYAFMGVDQAGNPAHFDRCTPVHYRLNAAGAPKTFSADVTAALRQLSDASGLNFTYVGTTRVVPYSSSDWAAKTGGDADLYLAWATPRTVSALAGSTAGVGGNAYSWSTGSLPRITVAGVSLDATADVPAGFGTGATTGSLLLHELGHAVNLAHVTDASQIMYPALSASTRPAYQAGDLAGLARLKALPCFVS